MRLAATRPRREARPASDRADRIVANMLEARFDDLTGASPSFRLVEPVGVLEATRAGEVVAVLDAAEAAAERGLWVAGFVSYEAAPGLDPALVVRPRDPEDAFAALPLAWFAMFERAEETTLPLPRDEGVPPAPDGTWAPTTPRERFEAAVERIHELIAAGETYQVNHTMRLRSRVEGDARGLYRDLCYAQRGAYSAYLDLGRYRVLSASPELFFERRGGAIVTRPMKGTAPRGRWPEEDRAVADAAARLREGPRRERDDRGPPPQRPRPDQPDRLGHVGGRLPGRALRDRLAADDDRLGRARRRASGSPTSSAGSSRADRSPARRRSGRWRSSASSRTRLAGSTAARSATWRRRAPAGRTPGSTSRSARSRWTPPPRSAEYGVGGGITWDSDAEAEYEETVAKSRVLTARRPDFELLETMRLDPAEGVRHLDRHLDRLAASADYFGFRCRRDRGPRGRREDRRVRAARRDAASGSRSARTARCGWRPRRSPSDPDAIRVAIDDVAQDPRDVFLFHKTSLRARYEEARRRHPDADDVLLVNDRGEITESTIANVAVRIDGRWVTPPLDAGLLPGIGRAVALEEGRVVEGSVTIEEARSAEEIALISDARGWRRAVLV